MISRFALDSGSQVTMRIGDVLLYSGKGFSSWAIKVKTWSKISHCELYAGSLANRDSSYASRDGLGVNTYAFDSTNLVAILRPRISISSFSDLIAFHNSCIGQDYDWLGLMRFFTIGKQSQDKQFCSEYLTRLLRHGGFEPFEQDYDADLVSPGMFLSSAALSRIWVDKSLAD